MTDKQPKALSMADLHEGVPLRDYFAAAVIAKCLDACSTNARAAEEAYRIADEMIEARKA